MGRRTGNVSGGFPVFKLYIIFKTSNDLIGSPHSNKNFGLSGKKNNQNAITRLGIEHAVTNMFQLL